MINSLCVVLLYNSFGTDWPEGNTGSLRPIMRRVKNFICCKQDVMDENARREDGFSNQDLRNGMVVIRQNCDKMKNF